MTGRRCGDTKLRCAVLLASLTLVYFVYVASFVGVVGSNDGSHYALVRSVVEQGTFRVDGALQWTCEDVATDRFPIPVAQGDGRGGQAPGEAKAVTAQGSGVGGQGSGIGDEEPSALPRLPGEHFYSNKPPGTAMLAVPFYWLGRRLEPLLRLYPPPATGTGQGRFSQDWVRMEVPFFSEAHKVGYPGTLQDLRKSYVEEWQRQNCVNLLPALLGVACTWLVYRLCRQLGTEFWPALVTALLCAVGTIQWRYSTALFSHIATAALLLALVDGLASGWAWRPRVGAVVWGLLLGFQICVQYQVGLFVPFLVGYWLWRAAGSGQRAVGSEERGERRIESQELKAQGRKAAAVTLVPSSPQSLAPSPEPRAPSPQALAPDRRGWRALLMQASVVGVAAIVPLVVLAAYQWACFGSPWINPVSRSRYFPYAGTAGEMLGGSPGEALASLYIQEPKAPQLPGAKFVQYPLLSEPKRFSPVERLRRALGELLAGRSPARQGPNAPAGRSRTGSPERAPGYLQGAGLLTASPFLIAALVGWLVLGWRARRPARLIATLIPAQVAFLVFVREPTGGATYDARYLAAVIPLWALGFGLAADAGRRLVAGLSRSPNDAPRNQASPDREPLRADRTRSRTLAAGKRAAGSLLCAVLGLSALVSVTNIVHSMAVFQRHEIGLVVYHGGPLTQYRLDWSTRLGACFQSIDNWPLLIVAAGVGMVGGGAVWMASTAVPRKGSAALR